MLYDPKWEKQTKADPLTLAGLIAWLETKPSEGTYDWWNVGGCLLCNYLRETFGVQMPSSQAWSGHDSFGPNTLGPSWGYYEVCQTKPWTYGAALERARKHIAA